MSSRRTGPALEFRHATADDATVVIEFWGVAAEDSHRPADTRDAVLRLITRDPEALLLVLDDGVIVGSVVLGWDGWRCHVYRLAVRPSHRRQGIGEALLEAVDERVRSRGAIRADAMVLDDNALGQRIWVQAGYTRQQEWSRWVKPVQRS